MWRNCYRFGVISPLSFVSVNVFVVLHGRDVRAWPAGANTTRSGWISERGGTSMTQSKKRTGAVMIGCIAGLSLVLTACGSDDAGGSDDDGAVAQGAAPPASAPDEH
jgi:hypothetical protein